jgi:hypothetical protein
MIVCVFLCVIKNILVKKLALIVICATCVFSNAVAAKKNKKNKDDSSAESKDFRLPDKVFLLDSKAKKRLQKSLTPDQFVQVIEELAQLRLLSNELNERIKVYEELEAKVNEEKQKLIAQYTEEIERLKNAVGNGEVASPEFIQKIKAEGIDRNKLKFRVQIGEYSSYKNATKAKNRLRADGEQTWILPVYMGFVIPLKLVEGTIQN